MDNGQKRPVKNLLNIITATPIIQLNDGMHMNQKLRFGIVALLSFVLGAIVPNFLLKKYYAQRYNDNAAYSLDVELNAGIVRLKDFDEHREEMLKQQFESDLNIDIQQAKILLNRSDLSSKARLALSTKVSKAELALKDRTKTLDELLFSDKKPLPLN